MNAAQKPINPEGTYTGKMFLITVRVRTKRFFNLFSKVEYQTYAVRSAGLSEWYAAACFYHKSISLIEAVEVPFVLKDYYQINESVVV